MTNWLKVNKYATLGKHVLSNANRRAPQDKWP